MGKTYVCKTKCYHGKLYAIGASANEATLLQFGPVPKHFVVTGSTDAEEAKAFDEAEECRNILRAECVAFPANLGVKKLKALVKQTRDEKKRGRSTPGGIVDPLG